MKKVMFTIGISLLGTLTLVGIGFGIYSYIQSLNHSYLKYYR